MKKHFLFLLTIVLSFNCHSQISFEKGYFIDNNNQKTYCLIKNADWRNNPTEFEYKLSDNDESKIGDLKSVKEFSVDNFSKYIRSNVNIDRSQENINELSDSREPIFIEEDLFLKVLVEGKYNLFEYSDDKVKRFFYNSENSKINQLIYKSYKTIGNKIAKNNGFRQQLWIDLKCPSFKMSEFNNVDYIKKDLVRIFTEYSECHNYALINLEPKQHRDLFNLTIRPRLNNSSLSVKNAYFLPKDVINFENKSDFGFGLEAEFIFPFNKNKWAFLIEPTYQQFKSQGFNNNIGTIFGGELSTKIEYSSIEIPLGFRHYFFLQNNSKIFVNASFVFDVNLKSSLEGSIFNGSAAFTPVDKSSSTENLAFGIGYKLHNKYSLEMRYQTGRQIIGDIQLSKWLSDYRTFSIIVGYSLF